MNKPITVEEQIENILIRNGLYDKYCDAEIGSFSEAEKIMTLIDKLTLSRNSWEAELREKLNGEIKRIDTEGRRQHEEGTMNSDKAYGYLRQIESIKYVLSLLTNPKEECECHCVCNSGNLPRGTTVQLECPQVLRGRILT